MRRAQLQRYLVVAFVALYSSVLADGFRPESPLEQDFIDRLGSAEIVVLPTVVRDPGTVGYSLASRQLIVDYLDKRDPGGARAMDLDLKLGVPAHRPQYELFMDSLGKIGMKVSAAELDTDYAVVLEVVFPPVMEGRIGVFGIHMFILTPDGQNAFSFLLNSHHASFRRAGLSSSDTSAQSREKLVMKSTTVALNALEEQVSRARECAPKPGLAFATTDGLRVVDDFESKLPLATDGNSIPIGFSTFNGSESSAWMWITDTHPPRPDEDPGNHVLQIDVDVKTWAGVLHRFEGETQDQWVAYDWRGARELSFWLYGNGSGTALAIDVLDNRHGCSISDDAERYRYEFTDDFAGWRLFSIPFEVMTRADVGNDAPNDGLGLSSVNGWGLGVLKTYGPKTWYIDDVHVRYAPILETMPAGELREKYVWCPVNELPMFGGFEKTAWQREADEKFVKVALSTSGGSYEAAAEKYAQMGWNFYYRGDRTKAIKRFNQAWLLDADNQHALWGFAVISVERGKIEEAIRFYDLAIEKGSPPPKLVEEYERLKSLTTTPN
jgi:hypothetical protein